MATAESVVRSRPQLLSESERRVHRRAHLDGPVLVDAHTSWQHARCENISEGGVALGCDHPLPLGRTVEVYFELPSGVAVETRALVIRSSDDRAALRFLELDRPSVIALRHHCRTGSRRDVASARAR